MIFVVGIVWQSWKWVFTFVIIFVVGIVWQICIHLGCSDNCGAFTFVLIFVVEIVWQSWKWVFTFPFICVVEIDIRIMSVVASCQKLWRIMSVVASCGKLWRVVARFLPFHSFGLSKKCFSFFYRVGVMSGATVIIFW